MKSVLTLTCWLFAVPFLAGQDLFKGRESIVRSEFIYQPGEVKFPSCHASTIVEAGNGILAAWFGGTAEKNPDVCIWLSRYTAGKWSRPAEAANGVQPEGIRYPCWNPVLYNSGDEILLFYKVGPGPSEWWGELKTSDDNGISWSAARRLPEGMIGPVKDKPVLLGNGVLLCPSSTENDGWRLHMEMTRDNGITWEKTGPLNDRSTSLIQPTILFHPAGRTQLLCRSRQSKIFTAWSDDNGYHWSTPAPTELPNPNSGIDALTLSDSRHLLVYNHLSGGRNMLNVALSEDGIEWKAAVLLENDEKEYEYSYPAVIQSADGLVHITYTWRRRLIRHVVIDPVRLTSMPFDNGRWPFEPGNPDSR